MKTIARYAGFAILISLFCMGFCQTYAAEPETASRLGGSQFAADSFTVPFTALQIDANYRPHQLITIGIRKDLSSPVIPATFLFDTGTNTTLIAASLAEKLGLPQYDVIFRNGSHTCRVSCHYEHGVA
jgi:hypothetical protein